LATSAKVTKRRYRNVQVGEEKTFGTPIKLH